MELAQYVAENILLSVGQLLNKGQIEELTEGVGRILTQLSKCSQASIGLTTPRMKISVHPTRGLV